MSRYPVAIAAAAALLVASPALAQPPRRLHAVAEPRGQVEDVGPEVLHGLDGRFGLGGGAPELLGNPLYHLRFSHRALLRVLGGCKTRAAPAVGPGDRGRPGGGPHP